MCAQASRFGTQFMFGAATVDTTNTNPNEYGLVTNIYTA